MSKAKSAKPALPDVLRQRLSWNCDCGASLETYLSHFELARCAACGRFYWALQPHRNGGLVVYHHPGQIKATPANQQGVEA